MSVKSKINYNTAQIDNINQKLTRINTFIRPIEEIQIGNGECRHHSKTVTPSETGQRILPDSGFNGLSYVIVTPIPSEYIIPSGNLDINGNGEVDVTNYATVNVNVQNQGGGAANMSFDSTTGTLTITE